MMIRSLQIIFEGELVITIVLCFLEQKYPVLVQELHHDSVNGRRVFRTARHYLESFLFIE